MPNPLLLKNISIFKIPMKDLDEEEIENPDNEELEKVNDHNKNWKRSVFVKYDGIW